MKRILLTCFMLVFTLCSTALLAQDRTVSGVVTGASDGLPLPGVNILIKGTTTGVSTDANGNYSISVPANTTLVFRYLGFITREVAVGNQSVLNVSLQEDVQELGEVVVVGYGSTVKKEVTGSIASIKQEDIEKLPVSNVAQVLQGQSSGVFVNTASGTPGGAINVRVRGTTSVNGSSTPLYIIDGVPVVSGNIVSNNFGGQEQSALNGLNPQDIASIEVLKDPSQTAIYGARAANGVVIITTKQGKAGTTSFNVNSWAGVAEATNKYDLATAQQFKDFRDVAGVGTTWDGVTNVDWQDEVYRQALVWETNANVSGGDDRTRYYISGGYRNEEATYIGGALERLTGRFNLDHKASDIVDFSARVGISNEINSRIQNDNNIYGIISSAILTPSTNPVYTEDGDYADALPAFGTNPLRAAELKRNDIRTTKLVGNFRVNFNLFDGFTATMDASIDNNVVTEDVNNPASTSQGRPTGTGNYANNNVSTWTLEPRVTYQNNFKGKGNYNVVAGATWQKRRFFGGSVAGNTFGKEELTYLNSAANITGGSSYLTPYSFMSQFARAVVSWDEKYIFNASIRRDGSSRFGSGQKFGTFWSVSGAWNFGDESFFDNVEWVSAAKLRAGYGIVGNDGIGNFQYTGFFGSGNYLGRAGFVRGGIENPDLKWEETATLDIGLDLTLFNGDLDFSASVYEAKTTDLLFQQTIPATTGFTAVQSNVGDLENRGLELEAKYYVIDNSNLRWSITGNIAWNENKIIKLASPEPVLSGFASVIKEGEAVGSFWGQKWLGVDAATGESVYEDINGDGVINGDDRQIIGSGAPGYYGGFSTNLSWNGFTIDAFFQFVGDVNIYNNTAQFSYNPRSIFQNTADLANAWKQPGDVTHVPRLDAVSGFEYSNDNSRWIDDGAYMRLKNLTVSYDFGTKFLANTSIKSLRLYFTGTNLITWTKYRGIDPEISTFGFTNTAPQTEFLTVPQSRMYSLGINLGL